MILTLIDSLISDLQINCDILRVSLNSFYHDFFSIQRRQLKIPLE